MNTQTLSKMKKKIKYLALCALLAASYVSAETIAIAEGTNGVTFRLTDESCHIEKLKDKFFFMVATSPSGDFKKGCWVIVDDLVYVKFDTGEEKLYPLQSFKLPKQKEKTKKQGMI